MEILNLSKTYRYRKMHQIWSDKYMKSQSIRSLISANVYPKNARKNTHSCLVTMKSITDSILIFLHRLSSTLDVSCEKHDSWTCFNTWFSQLKAYCEIKIKILACQNLRTLVIKQLGYNFWRYAVPFLCHFCPVDVYCCLFSTVRCSIPRTTRRFPSSPVHPLIAPRCYIRLWRVIH